MQLALDLLLIRSLEVSELRLAPGRTLLARVVRAQGAEHGAQGSERGLLSIAGAVIDAELPRHLRAGDELRLTVRHVSTQRILLTLSDQPPPPVAPASVPLPGGGAVRVAEREQTPGGRPGGALHTLSLRYDAPVLGAVDLRFELHSGALRLTATLAAGDPLERARESAEQLREALAGALDRPVNLTIAGRREPLEVYA